MSLVRIVVLTVTLGAAGYAAFGAIGSSKTAPVERIAQAQTVEIVAASVGPGPDQSGHPDELMWQTWPAVSASNSLIRLSARPNAGGFARPQRHRSDRKGIQT